MSQTLREVTKGLDGCPLVRPIGRVSQVVGTIVEVRGLVASMGDLCWIERRNDKTEVAAEVVGFQHDNLLLMPYDELIGLSAGCRVTTRGQSLRMPVGAQLLGRVVDAFGRPLDGGPVLQTGQVSRRHATSPNPLSRQRITEVQQTGVRAIDSFVTCAKGQRVGIFAGSGVGKSVLLGMISRHSDADVNVVALIGERGREVREFVEEDLGPEGLARTVVVVATSDQSPVLRIRAAESAMSVAEWFRGQNKNVMLVMDSVTRFAMAQREIGLAVGEPPATKGYPPSTFAMLARLLERAGTDEVNAITAFFTVLVEGDDLNEPIGDAVRSIVDGHIVLSRDLARRGQYPAVDVMGSVSRLMNQVTDDSHRRASQRILGLLKLLEDNQDLITIGAYKRGANADLDRAVDLKPRIEEFLRQGLREHHPIDDTLARLAELSRSAETP
jgi:flagellum-specific ATP synthase